MRRITLAAPSPYAIAKRCRVIDVYVGQVQHVMSIGKGQPQTEQTGPETMSNRDKQVAHKVDGCPIPPPWTGIPHTAQRSGKIAETKSLA
jgi:hypothetical protein